MVYIGIDNGVSGSIGIITSSNYFFYKTPVFKQQDYTKKKKLITRINSNELFSILKEFEKKEVKIFLERPMINSLRFNASISAARACESTLNVIELLNFSYQWLDSKQWQRELLPAGVKTAIELKAASFDIGCRLFPKYKDFYKKQKDADGILITEWGKRFENGTLKNNYKGS